MRLDKYLVEKGYFESRNRALDAIKRGKVFVNGVVAKASIQCDETSNIDIDQEKFYVSRAAKKLELFLEEYSMNLEGKRAVDVGSSTGGFVQILLENNVASVACVDVGSNQLHESIKADKRIIKKENTDIRDFKSDSIYDIVTCDVSFISILNILDDINRLATDKIIILYKPQFEVGNNVKRNSAGVVQDEKAIQKEKENFLNYTLNYDWKLLYNEPSQLAGKSGNIEELFYFSKIYRDRYKFCVKSPNVTKLQL